jgi:hypothetical protein
VKKKSKNAFDDMFVLEVRFPAHREDYNQTWNSLTKAAGRYCDHSHINEYIENVLTWEFNTYNRREKAITNIKALNNPILKIIES